MADDSDIAGNLLERLLEQAPDLLVIGRVRSGEELLATPLLAAADVVLLDLLMPRLAGLSVLPRLPHGCSAVGVSGASRESSLAQAALAQGARGYISKAELRGAQAARTLQAAVRAAHAGRSRAAAARGPSVPGPGARSAEVCKAARQASLSLEEREARADRTLLAQRARVVVADDSDIAATLLEDLLEGDRDIQVIGRAGNGAELLTLPNLSTADVIVLDLLMPEMAGLTALPRLPEGCRVVAVSGDSSTSDLARAARAQGAREYLSKADLRGPQAGHKLRGAVRAAVASLRPVQAGRVTLPYTEGVDHGQAGRAHATGGAAQPAMVPAPAAPVRRGRVRVVIADDSALAVELFEGLLAHDPTIEVVGTARSGDQLLGLPVLKAADVVLLDLLMPQLAGLSALPRLIERCGVVAVSGDPRGSPLARAALGQGATEYLSKRELRGPGAAGRLSAAVRSAGRCRGPALARSPVLLVAGSTGAVELLAQLLGAVADLSLPALVVQHMPPEGEAGLARFITLKGMPAQPATHGAVLAPGAFVAPSNWHLGVDTSDRMRLIDGPPQNGFRPSADVLFDSAVPSAARAIAVMLPGLGNDGARAMARLAEGGGACFALHPDDCRAPHMPRAALAASTAVAPIRASELADRVRRQVAVVAKNLS